MKRADSERMPNADPEDDSDRLMDDDGDDGSEVEASSVEGQDDDAHRKDVEGILESTGKQLKRGKTMAMKEAISSAKKAGVSSKIITKAEKQLDDYKRKQKKEEVTAEVEAFFASQAARDILLCERMVKKATEAECEPDMVQKLQAQLDELVAMRPLEDGEIKNARDCLMTSVREFVAECSLGRSIASQDVERGRKKVDGKLSLDSSLMTLVLERPQQDMNGTTTGDTDTLHALVDTLTAVTATREKEKDGLKGLAGVWEDDLACMVVLRYSLKDGSPGLWCLVESSKSRRDRFVEAITALAAVCTNRNRAGG